jgi:hypothetical protein
MIRNQPIILPLLYLGNIQYWSKLICHQKIIFNDTEKYPKGTFRNRSHLVSSQGILRLSIPLLGGKHTGRPYKEIKIDNTKKWQKNHWQSICTCYGSAPFFHHYHDKLKIQFEKEVTTLWEWNINLTVEIISWLKADFIRFTHLSEQATLENTMDLTHFFSPKSRFNAYDPDWIAVEYPQIFERTLGFLPNCSILDLIFCQGPYALNILKKSDLSEK